MKLNKKPRMGSLIILSSILLILVSFIIWVGKGVNDMEEHPEKYNEIKQEHSIISKNIGITQTQAKEIENILKECKIEDVSTIKHDKTLDEAHKKGDTGYRVTWGNIDNIILCINSQKKVCRVAYSGHPLYKNNKVVATLNDYTFTSDELNTYQTMCINAVTDILKSPSTAKFASYSDWGFIKKKNKITVQGYVDSENSLGATIRSQFQIKINKKKNSITSFIFDGKELMK